MPAFQGGYATPSQKITDSSVDATGIQKDLWPDNNAVDPAIVGNIYDAAAKTYSVDVMADGWQASLDRIFPEINKALAKGAQVVLDAGCASGLLAEQYTFPGEVKLHGVDISSECLQAAEAGGKYSSLQKADLQETLPFEPETFDLVVCNGVLGYCATNKPLSELVRVLKTGCHLLVTMRRRQFEERSYREALQDNTSEHCLIRSEVFDPFPNNPAYKHEYIFALIQKVSPSERQRINNSNIRASVVGSTYCPYESTSRFYDKTRLPLGLSTVVGALALNSSGTPLASQRLLDVGCGTGSFLEFMLGKVREVVGVDASDGMLTQARARPALKKHNVQLSLCSANKLAFPDASFDGVISNQVIHHFPAEDNYKFLEEYIAEAYRVLKVGGKIIINTSSPEQQRDGFWWLELFPKASTDICSRFPPIATLLAKLEKVGFKVGPDSVVVPLRATLMGASAYLSGGVDSAFSEEYRAGDSSWAMAEKRGELEEGLQKIRDMRAAGTVDAWLQKREALRMQLGQATFVVAEKVKPIFKRHEESQNVSSLSDDSTTDEEAPGA
eukprot:gnl/TRDRNA2_/TRDRNA2_177691_c2_seq1.p1 gnl/TRDRNA2_/TRDRNA2_177691_c2~~gnl/TRDRNA2_/TRDRNA2_177691_c2_seq1.p1  ORF type:complete len:557 (-),score=96.54 gnl/TRDRNA2_/TRDRNA2_177691_c2_seq1:35-1705(-)